MDATPLRLERVLGPTALADAVRDVLSSVPTSDEQEHGITIRPRKKDAVRALVFWGSFDPNADALANRIRDAIGDAYQVSQCRSPDRWGKYRTATQENPYEY